MVLIFSSQFTVSTNCLASWYLQQYVLTSWQHFSFFWGVKINFPGLYFSRTKGWLNVVNRRDKLKKKVEFMWDTGDIRSFKALSALRQILVSITFTLAISVMTSACKLTCEKASGKQVSLRKRNTHHPRFLLNVFHRKSGLFKLQLRVILLHFPVLLFVI